VIVGYPTTVLSQFQAAWVNSWPEIYWEVGSMSIQTHCQIRRYQVNFMVLKACTVCSVTTLLFACLQLYRPKVNCTAERRNRIQDCHKMVGQRKWTIFISWVQGLASGAAKQWNREAERLGASHALSRHLLESKPACPNHDCAFEILTLFAERCTACDSRWTFSMTNLTS
jgi:hypothetical protein